MSTVLFLGFLFASLVSGMNDGRAMHCIERPNSDSLPETGKVFNGQVVDSFPSDLDPDSIEIAETICWDKAERMFDVRVRSVVASVWTRPGPYTLLNQTLLELVQAQRSHWAQSGQFARIDALEAFEIPSRISIEVKLLDDGFVAVAAHDQFDSLCYVYLGAVPSPLEEMEEAKPRCQSQHGLGPWGTKRVSWLFSGTRHVR